MTKEGADSMKPLVRLCGTCWHWEFHARKVKPMRSWCGGPKRRYRSRIQHACEHWIDKPEWMKPNAGLRGDVVAMIRIFEEMKQCE